MSKATPEGGDDEETEFDLGNGLPSNIGICPFNRERRASSSCVSLMYSTGGRGLSGGGVDAEVAEVSVGVVPFVTEALPLGMIGGGGDLRVLPESLASYFARKSAFSSTAVNTRELPEPAAGGTGVGLDPALVLVLGLRPGDELPFVLGDAGGFLLTLLVRGGG